MPKISDFAKSDDFKKEKHAPVIEIPNEIKTGENFNVTVTVGKEIAHPNTTEHFIGWISLYFKPDNDNFVYSLGKVDFQAHGASAKGPNTIGIHSNPSAVFSVKLDQSGTLLAGSYCNIHGLWESSKEIKI